MKHILFCLSIKKKKKKKKLREEALLLLLSAYLELTYLIFATLKRVHTPHCAGGCIII